MVGALQPLPPDPIPIDVLDPAFAVLTEDAVAADDLFVVAPEFMLVRRQGKPHSNEQSVVDANVFRHARLQLAFGADPGAAALAPAASLNASGILRLQTVELRLKSGG